MAITYEPYVKTGDNTYEEIKFPYNVLSDAPDLSEYVTKSGEETISGVKIFTSAPKMDTLENSRGNAMYHFNGSKVYFGQTTFPITLRGNGVRPKYLQNGDESELALYNDLLNYVPAQSGDGTYYSQVENENGEVSLRTFKNGDTTDTASVRVKKDGTVILQGTADRPQYQKGGDSAVDIALFNGSHADSDTGKVAVVDSDGLICYRTPVEVANDGVEVVTLDSSETSGTLSAEDLVKVQQDNTIIDRGGIIFIKSSATSTRILYSATILSSATIQTGQISITVADGTYSFSYLAAPQSKNVVSLSGTQTIKGDKTFTKNIIAPNFNSRFALQSVPYGTAIGSSADLNTTTYLGVGNYYCSADNIVNTLTNCPTTHAFMMTVYSPLTPTVDNETTDAWVYRVRKLMTYQCEEFIQYVNSGSTAGTFSYGAWQQIAHKGDIPTVPTKTSQLTNDSKFIVNNATRSGGISILGGTDTVSGSVEIGDGARTNGTAYSTAVGRDATSGYQSVAFGSEASADDQYCVAVGYRASATQYGIAIGNDAESSYVDSISLGYSTQGPPTAPSTRIGCGSYTSTGRGLLLGVDSTGYTYMNSAGASWSSASDIRDKTDIETIDHALDFITKLKPITYVMNEREKYLIRKMGENGKDGEPILDENGKQQYDKEAHARGEKKKHRRFAGLSAQDTYQAMLDCYDGNTNYAQIVDNNKFDHPDDEYIEQYSMSYERLVPFLIKAMQEQQSQIDELKSELEKLKS